MKSAIASGAMVSEYPSKLHIIVMVGKGERGKAKGKVIRSHHFFGILTASQAIFDWTEADFIMLLKDAATTVKLIPVGEVCFSFAPQGVSAVLLLAESHVALHFWPEERKVTIDIHVCDYQSDNQEKAKLLAKILAIQISGNYTDDSWNYLTITK